MIRKLIIPAVCLLLLMGCSQTMTPTVSLLTGTNVEMENEDMEYVGRVGLQVDKTAFGLATHYLDNTEIDQQFYGVYIIQDLISDPNAPFLGNWYIGAQATLNLENKGGQYGPILGTRSYLGGIEILTEFQYRHYNQALATLEGKDEDKYKVITGPQFRF
jgi:hypothetical protein